MAGRIQAFPWVGASAVAALLIVLVVGGLPGPGERGRDDGAAEPKPAPGPTVALAELPAPDGGGTLRAEFILQDPTPLFLPTPLNSGQADATMTSERSPGTSFGPIPAKLLYPTENNRIQVPDVVQVPPAALPALRALDRPIYLTELPRADRMVAPLPGRTGYLEVYRIGDGQRLFATEIEEGADDALSGSGEIVPVELLLAIDRSGLLGQPTVVNALDETEVDLVQLADVLAKARLGAHLRPGIYRILLGP